MPPSTREQMIDRVAAAVVIGEPAEIAQALADLKQEITSESRDRVKRASGHLAERITRLERQVELMQRHLQMVDRILEEQARATEDRSARAAADQAAAQADP